MADTNQLRNQLTKLRNSNTLIIGIGNTLKGDDGIGPEICRRLKEKKINADIIDAGTVPENYIGPIIKKSPKNILIIDAIDFAGKPGEMKLFAPEQLTSIAISTHAPSPALFLDAVRKDIKPNVLFIGIQPAQTTLGQPISDSLEKSANLLVELLKQIFPPKN